MTVMISACAVNILVFFAFVALILLLNKPLWVLQRLVIAANQKVKL